MIIKCVVPFLLKQLTHYNESMIQTITRYSEHRFRFPPSLISNKRQKIILKS